MKRLIIGLTSLTTLLVACGSSLPETRPDDFSAGYSFDGGMLPWSDTMTIDPEGSRYRINNEGLTLEILFDVSEADLDSLHQTVRDNQIDRIRADREEDVYDRGGFSIRARYGEESYNASDSSNSFVKAQWSDEFSAILGALRDFADPGDPPQGTPLTVRWDNEQSYFAELTVSFEMGPTFLGLTGGDSGDTEAIIYTSATDGIDILFFSESSLVDQNYRVDLTNNSGFEFSLSEDGLLTINPLP